MTASPTLKPQRDRKVVTAVGLVEGVAVDAVDVALIGTSRRPSADDAPRRGRRDADDERWEGLHPTCCVAAERDAPPGDPRGQMVASERSTTRYLKPRERLWMGQDCIEFTGGVRTAGP
jgi:1,6-anhydro-N-acetylmuramate kinase